MDAVRQSGVRRARGAAALGLIDADVSPSRKPPAWRRYLQFWGANARRDVDDELRFHLEMRAAEYVAGGLSPADAKRRAEERFGSVDRAQQECLVVHETLARKEDRMQMLNTITQDAAYAVRVLRRQWIPSLAAIVCMAIGVSATAGMFSVTDRLLLRPLPYPNGDRLVTVDMVLDGRTANVASYLDYLDWRAAQHSFDDLAALWQADLIMVGSQATRVSSALVSANFFRTFGIAVEAGRTFGDADNVVGAAPVLVVSDAFARREFGTPDRALNRSVVLNGAARRIVGVLRDEWRYPASTDAWLPIETGGYSEIERTPSNRGQRNLQIVGALRPGVSIDVAQRDLAAIQARIAREWPASDAGFTTGMRPLRERYVGSARPALTAMIAATVLVLLIACANVAALQLARASARAREIAVRAAIGADRGRILRQLLTENVVLALAGGAAGVLLTIWSRRLIVQAVLPSTPSWMTFDIDWRVLAFALGVSMVSGIVFGLAPALDLGRRRAVEALRSGASAADSRARMQRVFVVAEVALSITLVVGAALSLESVARMRRIPLGIDPDGVVVFRATLQGPRYDSAQARRQFVATVERRLAALPGVRVAGAADRPPIIGCCSQFQANIEGNESASGHLPMITGTIASPGYFGALGIHLVAGRTFTAADDERGNPVMVINETFAHQYFPRGDAIGHRVNDAMIVGIVNDIKQNGLLDGPTPQFFMPWAQHPWPRVTFMVRTAADSGATLAAARRVLHDVDPTLPTFEATTMRAILGRATVSSRNFRNLLIAFAAIALLLAAAGLYGLTAFVVERRRRELGLRIALGAEPRAVRRLVLRQAAVLAGSGMVLGLAGSIAAARWLSATLYGVQGMSWSVYGSAAILLAVTAIVSAYGPARRASRVDPLVALRVD